MNQFLTIKELAQYISVKEKTLYSWVGKRVVPFYQIQGVIRFKKAEIDKWLNSCSFQSNDLVRGRVKTIENELGL